MSNKDKQFIDSSLKGVARNKPYTRASSKETTDSFEDIRSRLAKHNSPLGSLIRGFSAGASIDINAPGTSSSGGVGAVGDGGSNSGTGDSAQSGRGRASGRAPIGFGDGQPHVSTYKRVEFGEDTSTPESRGPYGATSPPPRGSEIASGEADDGDSSGSESIAAIDERAPLISGLKVPTFGAKFSGVPLPVQPAAANPTTKPLLPPLPTVTPTTTVTTTPTTAVSAPIPVYTRTEPIFDSYLGLAGRSIPSYWSTKLSADTYCSVAGLPPSAKPFVNRLIGADALSPAVNRYSVPTKGAYNIQPDGRITFKPGDAATAAIVKSGYNAVGDATPDSTD